MRKTWAVVKREFGAFVGTRAFLLGTLFGPLALLVLFLLPELLDGSGPPRPARIELVEPGAPAAARVELRERVRDGRLDGYAILPAEPGGTVLYEGRRGGLAAAAQALDVEEAQQPGGDLLGIVFFLDTLTYIVIMIYGISVLRSVQEEKDQRIVEVLLSSLRPGQLMTGKVLGIGAAGLLQVAIWIAFAATAFTWGGDVLPRVGMTVPALPRLPASLALVALLFFACGYFLYASLYAALGAIATTGQDAQNLQFPALIILMASFFASFAAIEDPSGGLAEMITLIPFTAPLIVPARTALGAIEPSEIVLSLALLGVGCAILLWLAGRVFRVTILATGSRPTPRRLWRWLRAG